VIPVVTPEEMAAVDAAAPEPVDDLIERAGAAVARAALEMMGGAYGRRVVVIAGPGNNGADGRACARRLERRGVRCTIVDAAFGTGLKRSYTPPARSAASAPVLAVDIPSGVDGLTGAILDDGRPWPADRTVSFAALKPGLLFEPGRRLAGRVDVVDIGLDVDVATMHVVETADVSGWLPWRRPDDHKWTTACRIVAGGTGMSGAATLASAAALTAGAGFVQLVRPGVDPDSPAPVEAVRPAVGNTRWAGPALDDIERFVAVLIGPGLGSGEEIRREVAEFVAGCDRPLVIDADGLTPATVEALVDRPAATILTPHDGEFARLGGDADSPDRIRATTELASSVGAHVVRKGPTTVVADPRGAVRLVTMADQRLATAGTGDVLGGIIVACLGRGATPFDAAAGGAHLHALASRFGPAEGLTAGLLVDLIPDALSEVRDS